MKVLAAVAGKHSLRGKHKYEPTPFVALWKGVKLNGHPQASPFTVFLVLSDKNGLFPRAEERKSKQQYSNSDIA